MRNVPTNAKRRGVGHLVALLLLCVFSTLGLAMVTVANSSLNKSDNLRGTADALLAAESGLNFMTLTLGHIRLANDTTEANFLPRLYDALSARLDGSVNLNGQALLVDSTCIYVPSIQVSGRTFRCWIGWSGPSRCRLSVEGHAGLARRTVSLDYDLVGKLPGVFDYGLASKGKITISGSARVLGVNDYREANVLSATTSTAESILISGSSVHVSGDLFAAGESSYVSIIGSPWIAGSSDPVEVAEHIHFGAETPDFPEVTTDHLRPLAVNVIDSTTKTISGGVYNNVVIKANTNPTFGNTAVFNGIVYIEQPNDVKFNGQVTINGFIVTEPGGDPSTCKIEFAGTCDSNGMDILPDTPEFAAVKAETGTFLLAPGFETKFTGTFSTINGSVAADQLTFTGTAEGTIKGTVVGLKDLPTVVGGNVDIFVDRKTTDPNPTGFIKSLAFVPDPDSYLE